jgi:MYXO-CTERM domain-containing protein
MEIDAAPEMPPADASPDAQDPSLQDAGMDASGQGPGNAPGCGCAVPGGAPRAPTLGVLAVLAGLFWRRRRPR